MATISRTDTNVTGNVNVTANFAIDTFTLTYTAGAGGTLTGETPQTVDYGGSGTEVTAVPGLGYHFVDWSDSVATISRTDTNVTGNVNVTANFAIDTFTLTYTAGAGGTLTGETPQTVDYGGSATEVTAVPGLGYHFVDWSDSVATISRTDTNVTGNVNVTANYTQDEYSLSITSDHGTVAKDPDQVTYHYGEVVQLTPTADLGWSFSSWSGDLTGSANPGSVTIHGNTSVTANYTQDEYSLSITSDHGTVAKIKTR